MKDLSRIGMNLIDVDDLPMNYLVTLNVRFIAINNSIVRTTLFSRGIKITQEVFIRKKEAINDVIARKHSDIEQWEVKLSGLAVEHGMMEDSVEQLRQFQMIDKLSLDVVGLVSMK